MYFCHRYQTAKLACVCEYYIILIYKQKYEKDYDDARSRPLLRNDYNSINCMWWKLPEVGAVKIGGASSSITITGNQLAELLKKRENGVFSKFLYILDGKTITSTDWE